MIDAYYNGIFCSYSNLLIPITDRSVFFADAVYEAAIAHGENIFLLDMHLNRLATNLKMLDFPYPEDYKNIKTILTELIRNTQYEDSFIYIQISRSEKTRSHSYKKENGVNLLAFILPFSPYRYNKICLRRETDVRHSLCNFKTTNLLPSVMAAHRAEKDGCEEVVFIRDGVVTECAHSNIFIRRGNVIITHPKTEHILPGITRQRVIEISPRLGFEAREEKFFEDDLFSADEVFITSTSKFSVKVEKISGISLKNDGFSASDLFKTALISEFFEAKQ